MADMKCPLEEADKWASHLIKLQTPFAFPSLLAEALVQVHQLYVVQGNSDK